MLQSNIVILSFLIIASVARDRKIAESVTDIEIENPREYEGEGGEATLVEELKEIKSND